MKHMGLCSFACVMPRLQHMSVCAVGVVRCRFMMTGSIVSGRLPVMLRCLLVLLGRLNVVGAGRMGA